MDHQATFNRRSVLLAATLTAVFAVGPAAFAPLPAGAQTSGRAETLSPQDLARRNIERRAVEAVIWGMPVVNYDLMRQAMFNTTAGKENQVIYWGRPLDWHNQTLTPNPDSIYFMAFYNTNDVGPVVLEVPPASEDGSLNVNIVNLWQMPLADGGPSGSDQGRGGKYLLLPPGYSAKVPDGYFALQPETYGGYALMRSNLKSHGPADVAKSVAYGKRVKVYPLSAAANPQETIFTDAQNVVFDSTIRYDLSFFTSLDRIVQAEPWLERDRAMIDQLKSIGIEKGKPFNPDEQTRKTLEDGVAEARALLEARFDEGLPPYFSKDSHWTYPVPLALIESMRTSFTTPNSYPVDDRGMAYSYVFVGIKNLGAGQFYLYSIKDKNSEPFHGGNTYRLTVPTNPPAEQYWSATAYDRELHTLIKNVDRASRSSQIPELQRNSDGSVDVYFAPQPPPGKETNWVPTDPQRNFEVIFRLYAPTKALFDKTWVLPDIAKVSGDSGTVGRGR